MKHPFTEWSDEDDRSIFEILEDHHGEDFGLALPVPGGLAINIYKFLKDAYTCIETNDLDGAKNHIDSLMVFFYTSATGQVVDLYNSTLDHIVSKESKNMDKELEEMIKHERQGDS